MINYTANKHKYKVIIGFFILLFIACTKQESTNIKPENNGKVRIKIKNTIFEDDINLKFRSAFQYASSVDSIQTATIDFNKDFYWTATIKPDSNIPTKGKEVKLALSNKVQYKVVVFEQNGTYITEKNFVYGKEDEETNLLLEEIKEYEFIVYSINSVNELPEISFSDPKNKTLATANVLVKGNMDFMYFRKNLTLKANMVNYLNVVLKHKFSKITTVFDVSSTGYKLTALESDFSPHNTLANINLEYGAINRLGNISNSAVVFTANETNSFNTIINADINKNISYTISNITIGPLVQTDIKPIQNLKVKPGVRYTLKLTLNPKDVFLMHAGYPAARINGDIWMRHNLGAEYSASPDILPITANRHGNYYQWGMNTVVANGESTFPITTAIIRDDNLSAKRWNAGTIDAPIKTAYDPCPDGYRIPTKLEYDNLVKNTVNTNIGNFSPGNTAFGSAKKFTSKRNIKVFLTFPAQGNFYFDLRQNFSLENRGRKGFYHSSTLYGNNGYTLFFNKDDIYRAYPQYLYPGILAQAKPIRCIAQ